MKKLFSIISYFLKTSKQLKFIYPEEIIISFVLAVLYYINISEYNVLSNSRMFICLLTLLIINVGLKEILRIPNSSNNIFVTLPVNKLTYGIAVYFYNLIIETKHFFNLYIILFFIIAYYNSLLFAICFGISILILFMLFMVIIKFIKNILQLKFKDNIVKYFIAFLSLLIMFALVVFYEKNRLFNLSINFENVFLIWILFLLVVFLGVMEHRIFTNLTPGRLRRKVQKNKQNHSDFLRSIMKTDEKQQYKLYESLITPFLFLLYLYSFFSSIDRIFDFNIILISSGLFSMSSIVQGIFGIKFSTNKRAIDVFETTPYFKREKLIIDYSKYQIYIGIFFAIVITCLTISKYSPLLFLVMLEILLSSSLLAYVFLKKEKILCSLKSDASTIPLTISLIFTASLISLIFIFEINYLILIIYGVLLLYPSCIYLYMIINSTKI